MNKQKGKRPARPKPATLQNKLKGQLYLSGYKARPFKPFEN
jgi:hypothetical protein